MPQSDPLAGLTREQLQAVANGASVEDVRHQSELAQAQRDKDASETHQTRDLVGNALKALGVSDENAQPDWTKPGTSPWDMVKGVAGQSLSDMTAMPRAALNSLLGFATNAPTHTIQAVQAAQKGSLGSALGHIVAGALPPQFSSPEQIQQFQAAKQDMAPKPADPSVASYTGGRGIVPAAGHVLAGMLPQIGPNAAKAGEQFTSGDTAGGIGTTIGTLGPFTLDGLLKGTQKGMQGVFDNAAGEKFAQAQKDFRAKVGDWFQADPNAPQSAGQAAKPIMDKVQAEQQYHLNRIKAHQGMVDDLTDQQEKMALASRVDSANADATYRASKAANQSQINEGRNLIKQHQTALAELKGQDISGTLQEDLSRNFQSENSQSSQALSNVRNRLQLINRGINVPDDVYDANGKFKSSGIQNIDPNNPQLFETEAEKQAALVKEYQSLDQFASEDFEAKTNRWKTSDQQDVDAIKQEQAEKQAQLQQQIAQAKQGVQQAQGQTPPNPAPAIKAQSTATKAFYDQLIGDRRKMLAKVQNDVEQQPVMSGAIKSLITPGMTPDGFVQSLRGADPHAVQSLYNLYGDDPGFQKQLRQTMVNDFFQQSSPNGVFDMERAKRLMMPGINQDTSAVPYSSDKLQAIFGDDPANPEKTRAFQDILNSLDHLGKLQDKAKAVPTMVQSIKDIGSGVKSAALSGGLAVGTMASADMISKALHGGEAGAAALVLGGVGAGGILLPKLAAIPWGRFIDAAVSNPTLRNSFTKFVSDGGSAAALAKNAPLGAWLAKNANDPDGDTINNLKKAATSSSVSAPNK